MMKALLARTGDMIRLADAARDRRAWAEAAEAYRESLRSDERNAPIWVQYGHALKESGRLADAEAAYRRSLQLAPGVADTQLQLGHVLKLQGQTSEAVEAYARALRIDPRCRDARIELGRMGWSGAAIRRAAGEAAGTTSKAASEMGAIALEISDLVDYLQAARYPTGIQRVQLSLASAMTEAGDEPEPLLVYFDHGRYDWVEVDRHQLAEIAELVRDGSRDEASRQRAAARLKDEILARPSIEFPRGCHLVNTGTSWGYWNYFLAIREAKRLHGLRYIALVHDCIPIRFPELCNPDLVKDFINWITTAIGHADMLLANSQNTLRDLMSVAREIGEPLPPTHIVRLDGEFSAAASRAGDDREAEDLLRRYNLDSDPFVLMVSTIEPRKNHRLALAAWSRMLKDERRSRVPRLVCVGASGWMNEGFYAQLQRDEQLRERVTVLNNISDQALARLYQSCLFTLFPSLYEGWGLPISEALAHGKVPLVSRISSHPEAGGELAVYFDLASEADFDEKLHSLIDDAEARRRLEQRIASAAPLRPWRQIGAEIGQALQAVRSRADDAVTAVAEPLRVAHGVYYSFARNGARRLCELMHSGDRLRLGTGWHAPEPWGCWVREGTAEIGFELDDAAGGEIVAYLHLAGSANVDNTTTISVLGSSWSTRIAIARGEECWQTIPLRRAGGGVVAVRLRLASEAIDDFAAATEGRDTRRSSIGIRGLYVCRADDVERRLDIVEAISRGNVMTLGRRAARVALIG